MRFAVESPPPESMSRDAPKKPIERVGEEQAVFTRQKGGHALADRGLAGTSETRLEARQLSVTALQGRVQPAQRFTDLTGRDTRSVALVEALPQRDDESRFLVVQRRDVRERRRNGRPALREAQRDGVFTGQSIVAVGPLPDLGDDRVRTQPHNRVVDLLQNDGVTRREAALRGNTDGRARCDRDRRLDVLEPRSV
jgi:hypothetical protein